MSSFLDAADALISQLSESAVRQRIFRLFGEVGLPTTSDEVWRYAPLTDFDLDAYSLAPTQSEPVEIPATLVEGALATIVVDDGRVSSISELPEGVSAVRGPIGLGVDGAEIQLRYGGDAFALLACALAPEVLVLNVAPGVKLDGTIVVVHRANSSVCAPLSHVTVGQGAEVRIVECLLGGDNSLVLPVGEYLVDDDASFTLATYQRLSTSAWHVARSTVLLGRNAHVRQSVVGLGGHYNRCRNDAEFLATGGVNELRTTYLGSGDQVHDYRTHQFHKVGRTTSTLISKGAVADESRSVYTGLIEIEKGAKRTNARQTNHNLLLSPLAHADTVPNLDIRENDVACAHASSVGPLDELQLWYLESRGVAREVAERLLVMGFFREMTAEMPASLAGTVDTDVEEVLARSRSLR